MIECILKVELSITDLGTQDRKVYIYIGFKIYMKISKFILIHVHWTLNKADRNS